MAPGGVGIPTGVVPGNAPFGGRMVVGGVGFTPGSPGGGGIITESLDGALPFGIWSTSFCLSYQIPVVLQ